MSTDYLLLDVDGVLNALASGQRARKEAWEQVLTIQGYRICVPLGTSEWVRELQECCRIVWCSTWEKEACTVLAPRLGFGADWPVVPINMPSRSDPGRRTLKLRSVKAWAEKNLAPGDRLAWVDDELAPDAWEWAAGCGRECLLLAPDSRQGWTREHVDALVAFATRSKR